MDWLAWVVIALILVFVGGFIALYKRLVRLRSGSEEAWAQLEAQLKGRHDLVPGLVAGVKGQAAHEPGTLDAVTRAHVAAGDAPDVESQARAENILSDALERLLALAEAHPPPQGGDDFLALREELSETEGRIGFARQYYNERVIGYGRALNSFPSNLVAAAFGFRRKPLFETEPPARAPSTVDLKSREQSTSRPASGGWK
jgi:LemA protein